MRYKSDIACLYMLKGTLIKSQYSEQTVQKLLQQLGDVNINSEEKKKQFLGKVSDGAAAIMVIVNRQTGVLEKVFNGFDARWSNEAMIKELYFYWLAIYASSERMRRIANVLMRVAEVRDDREKIPEGGSDRADNEEGKPAF